ncbi:MAG: tripartite tricarboxylate transporter substrate binding protein [Betaproteobacteria bacterium]
MFKYVQMFFRDALKIIILIIGMQSTSVILAADYPIKPIKLVVSFAPGGGTDVIARIIGKYLTEELGQPVIVENKAGGGGNIGARFVAGAEPDGYTILVTSTAFAINPSFYKNAGYDPIKQFVPIINAGYSPTILFVHPDVKATNLKELMTLAKTNDLSYASAGIGTVPFLTSENLNKLASVSIVHIPFGGAGPALNSVIGGQVPVGSAAFATPGLIDWLNSGKIRPIAISSEGRSRFMPNVPTIAESGYPGVVDNTWIAFFAPAKTPNEIVVKLNQLMSNIIKKPVVMEQISKIGFDWSPNTNIEFTQYIQGEVIKWGKIVKETGIAQQ